MNKLIKKIKEICHNPNWDRKLSKEEIIQIYFKTKSLPAIPFRLRAYCFINAMSVLPKCKEHNKNLKFGSIKYGFFKKCYDVEYKFCCEKNIDELKKDLYTNRKCSQKILSFLDYDFLKEIMNKTEFVPNDSIIQENIYCYCVGIKDYPKCEVCKKNVAYNKHFPVFCSNECRLSIIGIKFSNKRREEVIFSKYGVKFLMQLDVFKQKSEKTSLERYGVKNAGAFFSSIKQSNFRNFSIWHKEICVELLKIFPKIKCLKNEEFIKLTLEEELLLKQYYICVDINLNSKVIELNGDFWHANPKVFTDKRKILYRGLTVEQITNHGGMRDKIVKKHGYELLTIWESDYLKNKKNIVEKCAKFLSQ